MPTTTTTITSANASGVTTTVTTTEAIPDPIRAPAAAPASSEKEEEEDGADSGTTSSPIEIGAIVSSVTVINATEGPKAECDVTALLAGKKVILIGVPGAFTPTCSNTHVPGYIKDLEAYTAKGIDSIICLSVNDGYVMNAWSESLNPDGKLTFIADPNGNFTAQLGFGYVTSLGGTRCRRFAALINNCKVEKLNLEPEGVPAACSLSPTFIDEL